MAEHSVKMVVYLHLQHIGNEIGKYKPMYVWMNGWRGDRQIDRDRDIFAELYDHIMLHSCGCAEEE